MNVLLQPKTLLSYFQKNILPQKLIAFHGRTLGLGSSPPVVAEIGAEFSHLGLMAIQDTCKYIGFCFDGNSIQTVVSTLRERKASC